VGHFFIYIISTIWYIKSSKELAKRENKMIHSNKVDLAKIRDLQEKVESLELEISRQKLELTSLKFGTKNYKNFMTEDFDINDYV